jgi:hypothetical protein
MGTRAGLDGYGKDKIFCIHRCSNPGPSDFRHVWSYTPASPCMLSRNVQRELYCIRFILRLLLVGWLSSEGLFWGGT